MDNNVELDKIVTDGFVFADTFAHLKIYKREYDRILYNPVNDSIYMTFTVPIEYQSRTGD